MSGATAPRLSAPAADDSGAHTHGAGDGPPPQAVAPAAALPADPVGTLLDDVARRPWAHDFHTLLRRIEALSPAMPRWGTAARPQQEPLRLGQAPELDFAPAPLAGLQPARPADAGQPARPARLDVRFFGLLGPNGPLPLHLSEYVREQLHQRGDATLARFLDLFHHRLLTLWQRAWSQSQPVVQRDRPAQDRWAVWLGSCVGLAPPPRTAGVVPHEAHLALAGLLAGRSRHAEGLAQLLRAWLEVPVQVVEHPARWLPIAPEDRSRLGPRRGRRMPAGLGRDATLGDRVWDRQYRVRIRLGPLGAQDHAALQPDGAAWPALCHWLALYLGPDLDWEVQLVLAADQRPAPRLGGRARLGRDAWLGRADGRDRDDLCLRRGQPRPVSAAHAHGPATPADGAAAP